MAVGLPETDRLFDRQIRPALRKLQITPIFMGRLEHNDDIDDRIIREIRACDFAIADLTYARPSVYFEAGYAQREVPVIYTCRKDHLKPRADDKSENLRVHFDLQMRNIIPWSKPDHQSFIARLTRRVKTVIRPLLRQRLAAERLVQEETAFRNLPLASRQLLVMRTAQNTLRRAGWRSVPISGWHQWLAQLVSPPTLNLVTLFVRAKWAEREIREVVDHEVFNLEPKVRLEQLGSRDLTIEGTDVQQNEVQLKFRGVSEVTFVVLLCSLEKVPVSRVAAALPSYAAADGNRFTLERTLSIRTPQFKFDSRAATFIVRIIDDIRSLEGAKTKTAQFTKELPHSKAR